jgi:hypothetical protein
MFYIYFVATFQAPAWKWSEVLMIEGSRLQRRHIGPLSMANGICAACFDITNHRDCPKVYEPQENSGTFSSHFDHLTCSQTAGGEMVASDPAPRADRLYPALLIEGMTEIDWMLSKMVWRMLGLGAARDIKDRRVRSVG